MSATARATSVREMIAEIQVELRADVSPARSRELLVQLSSLLGNCLSECLAADHAYSVVLLRFLDADEAANRAKIRAETSIEYIRKREAHNAKDLVLELARALKAYLRSCEEEMRLQR